MKIIVGFWVRLLHVDARLACGDRLAPDWTLCERREQRTRPRRRSVCQSPYRVGPARFGNRADVRRWCAGTYPRAMSQPADGRTNRGDPGDSDASTDSEPVYQCPSRLGCSRVLCRPSGLKSSTPSTGSPDRSARLKQTGKRSGHRDPGMRAGAGSRRTAGSVDERVQGQRLVDLDAHPLRSQVVGGAQAEAIGVVGDRFVEVSVGCLEEQFDKTSRHLRMAGSFPTKPQADAFAIGAVNVHEVIGLFQGHTGHQSTRHREWRRLVSRQRRKVRDVWARQESEMAPQAVTDSVRAKIARGDRSAP